MTRPVAGRSWAMDCPTGLARRRRHVARPSMTPGSYQPGMEHDSTTRVGERDPRGASPAKTFTRCPVVEVHYYDPVPGRRQYPGDESAGPRAPFALPGEVVQFGDRGRGRALVRPTGRGSPCTFHRHQDGWCPRARRGVSHQPG